MFKGCVSRAEAPAFPGRRWSAIQGHGAWARKEPQRVVAAGRCKCLTSGVLSGVSVKAVAQENLVFCFELIRDRTQSLLVGNVEPGVQHSQDVGAFSLIKKALSGDDLRRLRARALEFNCQWVLPKMMDLKAFGWSLKGNYAESPQSRHFWAPPILTYASQSASSERFRASFQHENGSEFDSLLSSLSGVPTFQPQHRATPHRSQKWG